MPSIIAFVYYGKHINEYKSCVLPCYHTIHSKNYAQGSRFIIVWQRLILSTFYVLFFQQKLKHVFTIYVISSHWHDTFSWNHSSCKTMTYLDYIVNFMAAADYLAITRTVSTIYYKQNNYLTSLVLYHDLNDWHFVSAILSKGVIIFNLTKLCFRTIMYLVVTYK